MMHSIAAPSESAGARRTVSLVIVNARIWTGRPARPWADALAVSGKLLVAVGSSAEIRKLAGSEARVVDAARGLLVPGADGESLSRAISAMASPAADTAEAQSPILASGSVADFTLFGRDFPVPPPVRAEAPEPILIVAGGVVLRDASTGRS